MNKDWSKEFDDRFVADGSFKVQGNYLEVKDFIKELLTLQIEIYELDTEKYPFRCGICKAQFHYESGFNGHMAKHKVGCLNEKGKVNKDYRKAKKEVLPERVLFRIPFTWYWLARVAPFSRDEVKRRAFCLATKKWDGKKYYWSFLV